MANDHLRILGHHALGSRLKRLGERLQAQTQVILDDAGLGLPAAQFPLLSALDAEGPASVGDLAAALGLAQPGVTRALGQLEAEGLIASAADPDDGRIRLVSLTAKGERLLARARKTAFALVEGAVVDACKDLKGPLLAQIAALEAALEAAPLAARAPGKGMRRHG